MEIINKDYAIHMEISKASDQNVFRIKKKWRKLLNSRCRDLLEVDIPALEKMLLISPVKLTYYIEQLVIFCEKKYSNELRKRAGEGFDARSSLCKTIIALSKISADANHLDISGVCDLSIPNPELVREMLCYAKDYEWTEAQSVTVLLDELNRVNNTRTRGSHIHWSNKDRSLKTE